MKIALLTAGSRGDVQPYLALARALERAGHRCTILAQRIYEPLATEYGVRFHGVGGEDWPTPERLQEMVRTGRWSACSGASTARARAAAP